MLVIINTNTAATMAASNLANTNAMLQKSLNRLSSGSRIVNPEDDAGGLGVSMKLGATANRQAAVLTNLANSTSFLQTQDGVLDGLGRVLNRIGELETLYQDPTKNSLDKANYNAEFTQLQSEITAMTQEQFNGTALFGASGLNVATTADAGGPTVNVGAANLLGPSTSFTENFSNLSTNWTDTSTGGGTAVMNGSSLTLTNNSGSASVTSQATFSGPMTISLAVSGDTTLKIGSTTIQSFVGSLNAKFVLDGAGNYDYYLNNSFIGTFGGLATSGKLALSTGSTGTVSSFSVSDPGGSSGSGNLGNVSSASDLGALNLSTITSALQDIATYRAQNGAQQSRLGFASDLLTTNKANIEAANSRISDVDVASESTQLARYNILSQAGTAMLSQANQSSQVALRLLG